MEHRPMLGLILWIGSSVLLLNLFGTDTRGDTARSADDGLRGVATTQATIHAFQTQLVFPGARSQGQSFAQVHPPAGCELVTLHGPDGTKIAALFGASTQHHPDMPLTTLLYFYGNGSCMAGSLNAFNRFRGLGFNAIAVDYEGYGMSDGVPSEAGCYATADAVYDYVLKRNDVDPGRIVATGWSLGAAVAIDLASRKHLAGVATFSAFTNISDMSQLLAPGHAEIILDSRFDNLAKIASIRCPLFMAHGMADQLVPPEMLDRLDKNAVTRVTVVRVAGAAHNDIFQRGGDSLYKRLGAFVNGLPASAPTTRGG